MIVLSIARSPCPIFHRRILYGIPAEKPTCAGEVMGEHSIHTPREPEALRIRPPRAKSGLETHVGGEFSAGVVKTPAKSTPFRVWEERFCALHDQFSRRKPQGYRARYSTVRYSTVSAFLLFVSTFGGNNRNMQRYFMFTMLIIDFEGTYEQS